MLEMSVFPESQIILQPRQHLKGNTGAENPAEHNLGLRPAGPQTCEITAAGYSFQLPTMQQFVAQQGKTDTI